MGNQNISVELDSLDEAIGKFTSDVVDKITSLRGDWGGYLDDQKRDAWSDAPSCLAFGSAYVGAIEAYDAVMNGMKSDIVRYRDELQAVYDTYRNSDDRSMTAMNQRIAKLDDGAFAGDTAGKTAYDAHPNLDDGTDTPAARPEDTTPDQS